MYLLAQTRSCLLILLLILGSQTQLNAQSFKFGPKLGINIKKDHVSYEGVPEPRPELETRLGLNAGGLIRLKLTEKLGGYLFRS